MQVFYGRPSLGVRRKPGIVTVGVFDGMHRGHVRLIRKVVRRSRELKGQAVVITFSPHPVHVLRPDIYCPLIISLEHRLRLLEEQGVDVCLIVPFSRSFARLAPDTFIKKYLVEYFGAVEVFVGDDFRFGHSRRGTIAAFAQAGRECGFKLKTEGTKVKGAKRFSSSKVRDYIAAGQIKQAARVLGRPVALLGQVVHGDARGRKLGYPTANIEPASELLPPSGIYIVNVCWKGKIFPGIASVGRRPTFKKISSVNVEVHIFHFHKDLYGQKILVEFLKKIREEIAFRSKEELVQQIRRDEEFAKAWFSHRE